MDRADGPGKCDYDGLIVDLDGVVWLRGMPIHGAAQAIGVLLRAAAGSASLDATGRDAVFPGRKGLLPATGAVLAAIEVAADTTATVLGKPEPFIFEIARDLLAGADVRPSSASTPIWTTSGAMRPSPSAPSTTRCSCTSLATPPGWFAKTVGSSRTCSASGH